MPFSPSRFSTGARLAAVALSALVVALAAAASPANAAGPARGRHARPPAQTRLTLDLRLGGLYDSNPLEYSKQDQDAFLRRQPASRFAIRSVDDGVLRASGSIGLSRRLITARPTRVRYGYTRYAFNRDSIEDYRAHVASLRQPLPGRLTADLSWSRVPRLYVRHFWDDDAVAPYRFYPHYRAATLASRRWSLGLTRAFRGPWSVGARAERSAQDFNQDFDERDNHAWEFGASAGWARDSLAAFSLEVSRARRIARAVDPNHPAIPDSLRDDISSRDLGLAFEASFRRSGFPGLPGDLDLQLGFLHRHFTSARSADSYHHGRNDREFTVDVNLERDLRGGISPFLFWEHDLRRTSGIPAAGGHGEVSNYSEQRVGGGVHVSWSGRLP